VRRQGDRLGSIANSVFPPNIRAFSAFQPKETTTETVQDVNENRTVLNPSLLARCFEASRISRNRDFLAAHYQLVLSEWMAVTRLNQYLFTTGDEP
jgi:hypothetical protein